MKLILTGGGCEDQTKELDELFANLLDKDKPLLYIPIAIDSIKFPYSGCIEWLKKTFDKFGISKYEMITESELSSIPDKNIGDYSGVYIGGGNTPYLLKKLRDSGLWEKLKEAMKKDIPIYGGSAGAIIFSKSIKPSLNFDKNWVELEDFDGMNIIKDNNLFCHFEHRKEDKIKSIISEQNISSSIALTERNGLLVEDNKITLIGQEPAWIFDSKGNKIKIKISDEVN